MRKTGKLTLTLLASIASSGATSCSRHPAAARDCVDKQNHILPASACAHGSGGQSFYLGPHFVYGGASGGRVGDTVVGGSLTAPDVSRGGFGETAGDAAEGGEGSGE